MDKYNLIAVTTFGLEATVKREAIKLGFSDIHVTDGRVDFTGTATDIARANMWFRSAERVMLKVADFKATTFDELFEGIKALDWTSILPEDANFIITAKSIRSALFSVSDIQSITEKAIVDKLKTKYDVQWFQKSGATYKIQVGFLKDIATVCIDTSGDGLHKRGYRENAVKAPMRETLAHALIDLSYWRSDRVLLDPCCGSGTIAIEAALVARNIAPGLFRKFICEQWSMFDNDIWKQVRKDAYASINPDVQPVIYGSDIDAEAIETAKENAIKAGVDDCITFECKPFSEVTLPCHYGITICNPPYGERIGILKEVEDLYRDMGKLYQRDKTWSVYVITSNEDFEKLYGKRADAKRKLYNGMLKVDYYQYRGERPPKKA